MFKLNRGFIFAPMINTDFLSEVDNIASELGLDPEDCFLKSMAWVLRPKLLFDIPEKDKELFNLFDERLTDINPKGKGKKKIDLDEVRDGKMSFKEFWAKYDYKSGPVELAATRFYTMPLKHFRLMCGSLHIYLKMTCPRNKPEPNKTFRKDACNYLNWKGGKAHWIEMDEIYSEIKTTGIQQEELDEIFKGLRVNLDYAIAPNKEAAMDALEKFKGTVERFDLDCVVDSLQQYYDEKGKFGGKLANVLNSQDFRTIYLKCC